MRTPIVIALALGLLGVGAARASSRGEDAGASGAALAPVRASSRCDDAGATGAALAAARAEVRQSCACDVADGHGAYLRCAAGVVGQRIAQRLLPGQCAGRVRAWAARSVCGRDGAVVCCVKSSHGPWHPQVRADAASCRAPAGGASCVASIPNLDDACLRDAGCRQQHCGDGVVDLTAFEQCEPPGTATCDASCQFIHTCGNGVIEAGEECDGDPTCTPACTLARALCCDLGEVCIGRAAIDDFDQYFFSKNCNVTLGGETIAGTCEGVDACEPPAPPELGCRVGSCVDRAIDPLALCCQQAAGGCRDTVATTSGALGAFGCANFPPFNPGEVNRMLVGTCGTDGLCRPAH